MALQGQSFFQASGDSGAYSATNGPSSPISASEQAITIVGGTELMMSVNGSGRIYGMEHSWRWSGGGILSNGNPSPPEPQLPIPWYQIGAATKWAANGTSLSDRNAPDVSAVADGVEIYITSTSPDGEPTNYLYQAGTSFAAPLWAGYTALANAENAAANHPSLGFANPVLYGLASTPFYAADFFNDITGDAGNGTTYCTPDAGTCQYNTYYAGVGYDLVTGLGSPGTVLLSYLAPASAWVWNRLSQTGGPSAIASISGTPVGNTYEAWAIDTSQQVWNLVASPFKWTHLDGDVGVQIAVSPVNGYPWVLNSAGTVYAWTCTGRTCTFQPVSTGAVPMSWIAPGPLGLNNQWTAWALSKTLYQNDYVVWNYNVAVANSWSAATPAAGGLQIAVSPDSGLPWLVNHNGTVFVGGLSAQNYWQVVSNVETGGFDGGNGVGWYGTANAIAVGPDYQAWLLNNTTCSGCSFQDHEIFELSQFSSVWDSAWTMMGPGGGVVISMSANGTPWLINHNGTAFYGSPGWVGGGGIEGAVRSGSQDAGLDATVGVYTNYRDGGPTSDH
jgi:hypothetical protein